MKGSILLLCVFAASCACGAQRSDVGRLAQPAGVTFEFVHASHNETFHARTNDPRLIDQLRAELAKPAEQRILHPHGALRRDDDHGVNAPWHWSYVEDQWGMAEMSAEVCDGWPSDVEHRLDDWMHVGSFCPWSSHISREVPN